MPGIGGDIGIGQLLSMAVFDLSATGDNTTQRTPRTAPQGAPVSLDIIGTYESLTCQVSVEIRKIFILPSVILTR
jgi:hypothetical protein